MTVAWAFMDDKALNGGADRRPLQGTFVPGIIFSLSPAAVPLQ
ncbi:hypothetical protein SBA6_730012 [Candidatus Sulfopaludibacter sp. SbA6]|nr:hypothetical protein SBA6_730012 [Candidatus Sulfopaludibacter sp. SbA6]